MEKGPARFPPLGRGHLQFFVGRLPAHLHSSVLCSHSPSAGSQSPAGSQSHCPLLGFHRLSCLSYANLYEKMKDKALYFFLLFFKILHRTIKSSSPPTPHPTFACLINLLASVCFLCPEKLTSEDDSTSREWNWSGEEAGSYVRQPSRKATGKWAPGVESWLSETSSGC